jgi:hypothetical protein
VHRARWAILAVLLVAACGLILPGLLRVSDGDASRPQGSVDPPKAPEIVIPDQVEVIAKPAAVERVDENINFTHEYTRVRLCYPPGWTVGRPEIQGGLANIHAHRDGVSVMVFWGRTHSEINTVNAMLAKDVSELRKIYDDASVSDPEPVKVGDKLGYRLRYTPSPDRLWYLFYVDAPEVSSRDSWARGKWTIKVIVDGDVDLADEVLCCLRWE